jgi:hypothetical protein
MTTKKKAQTPKKGKGEVDHSIIAWALATTLAGETARSIVGEASELGGATGEPETFDLRPEVMLRRLLDGHTACAYDLDGQDRRKGQRAYDALVRLAGGAEGAPEPKDKTSDEWRHWTLRRIRADFESGDAERYSRAWRKFDGLLKAQWLDENRNHVSISLPMLAPLVMGLQQAHEYERQEARSAAARKGAQTRRTKAAKKGGV